jgi:hypothetical protein
MNQESITYPLLIGIASSLFATAIFILTSEIFRKIFLPWVSDKIYRGVRIDGVWLDESETSKFELKQWGNKITGVYSHETNGEITSYNVTGLLKNTYFMALTVPVSDKVIDAGAVLVYIEYTNSNLIMKGCMLYKDTPGEVKSWDNMLYKQRIS